MTEICETTYELSVSYDREHGHDAPIHIIVNAFGFVHVASGAGGCRDLHFERSKPLDEAEREKLTQGLKALGFPVDASIEVIEDDENDSWELLSDL